jgi:hypothetical protein
MLDKIKNFFARSETIFIARIQTFAGVVLAVVLAMDPAIFQASIPSQYWPLFLVVFGVALEYFRRRNDPSLGQPTQPNDPALGKVQ